jgi:hypothetical protein
MIFPDETLRKAHHWILGRYESLAATRDHAIMPESEMSEKPIVKSVVIHCASG